MFLVIVTIYTNNSLSIWLILTKISQNDGTRTGDKHIILVDLENMGQGDHIQINIASRPLYDQFQPYIHQNDDIEVTNKSHIS